MKNTLIVIGGPTAIGKTKIAVRLAKQFKAEIISADARQFYKELNLGVAKPSKYELKSIKHHFISHISIKDNYSVGMYEKEGLEVVNKLFKKHEIVFLCGGSGLYIDALCEGLNKFPKIKQEIQEQTRKDLVTKGLDFLNRELKDFDLETYKKIDKNNPRRVTRAIEVCRSTKKPYSFYLKKKKDKRDFNILFLGITDNREKIYDRINARSLKMISNGLIEEAQQLYDYRDYQSLQTIGYQEVFQYLDKKISNLELINAIQQNTRRYAKKQINWFKNPKYIQVNLENEEVIEQLIMNQL
tara:strand:- start:789 stop:1685 length:897 start_codon:yes stop_codon:yes gene_type:complete